MSAARHDTTASVWPADDSVAEFELDVADATGSAIAVRSGANPVIRQGTITAPGEVGVEVSGDGRGRFEHCIVDRAGGAAVRVADGSNATFRDCVFRSPAEAGAAVDPGGWSRWKTAKWRGAVPPASSSGTARR